MKINALQVIIRQQKANLTHKTFFLSIISYHKNFDCIRSFNFAAI